MNTVILIPAYQPDEKLPELCRKLKPLFPIVVVDDGSDKEKCTEVFEEVETLGIPVLHHEVNKGKGAALKTGIRYLKEKGDADAVITVDADGQHTLKDIGRVAQAIAETPDTVIIGGRDFSGMPPRSKFGNTVSRFFFRLFTGLKISDTQTGLRALPSCFFDKLLEIPGDRYEYEMNMLLELKVWNAKYREIVIDTVYIDEQNSSSHFHPVRDGLRVFSRIFKYSLSSISCAGIDWVLYLVFSLFFRKAGICYALARVCSSTVNYILNCKLVFRGKVNFKSFIEFALLVVFSMAVGSFTVGALTGIGLGNVLAKLIIDCLLFILNYFVQQRVIFKK